MDYYISAAMYGIFTRQALEWLCDTLPAWAACAVWKRAHREARDDMKPWVALHEAPARLRAEEEARLRAEVEARRA